MKIPITKIVVDDKTVKAAVDALKSGQWLHGKRTEEFENQFAKFCNTKYAVSVSSGTTALFLALKQFDVKNGDEVLVPSFSFVATASTVSMCGAKPIFVDVDDKNFTIDPNDIEKRITKKTKGIVPVHLFGHPADMNKIMKIAKQHSLFVLEDAAQAHGSSYRGKKIGSIGNAACFSFYPSKNLTVCGDGGMITSNDKNFINKIKILRNHGRKKGYIHTILGYNFRLNEIQAGIGLSRLKNLSKNNLLRRKIARVYDSELSESIVKPKEESWGTHVYHQYSILTDMRDKLQKYLTKNNISSSIFYPIPIHKQPMYKNQNRIKLPVSEKLSSKILSIPIFPTMTKKEQKFVINAINKFVKMNRL